MEFKDEIISTPEEIKDFLNRWVASNPYSIIRTRRKGNFGLINRRSYEDFRDWFESVLNGDPMRKKVTSRYFEDPKTQKRIPFSKMIQCKLSKELEEIVSPKGMESQNASDTCFIKDGLFVSSEGETNHMASSYDILIRNGNTYLIDLNNPVVSRSNFDDKDFYIRPYVTPVKGIYIPDNSKPSKLNPKRKHLPFDNLPRILVEPHEQEKKSREYYLFGFDFRVHHL